MWPKRMMSGLAGLVCLWLTGLPALAQDGVRDAPAAQLFDPADIRPYDYWNEPKEGFFFNFDGIFWTISAPKKTSVGVPGAMAADPLSPTTLLGNSFDTGLFRAKQVGGDRLEFGYSDEHNGFLVDTYELNCQTQILYGEDVRVVFYDPKDLMPPTGKTPANYGLSDFTGTPATLFAAAVDGGRVSNRTETDGIEALYTYRQHQFENGGQLTWMFGGRYVRFYDRFDFLGIGTLVEESTLANTEINNSVGNQIAGPEIGARWNRQFGRLGLNVEGRFMAGINSQNVHLYGNYGSLSEIIEPEPYANAFQSSAHATTFVPLVELRTEGSVQLTRLIALKVGWSGIFMDGIGRAADMITYQVPAAQINLGGNRQTVFMQGVNVGLELNH
jgi:hypothetical protein